MNEIDKIKASLEDLFSMATYQGDNLSPEISQILNQAIAHATSRISSLRNAQSIPGKAENLWVLSGANPSAFRDYLKTYPNPELNQISNDPGRLSNLESRLGNQITLPAGEQAGGVPKAPLNSSNIYGFAYDPRNSMLRVRFQGGGVYEYENVPPNIFKMFQSGAVSAKTNGRNRYGQWWVGKRPSLGATFFNLIRDQFPYQRVA